MIKILHTADVHLDSPFSSTDLRRAEIRQSELRAVFASMMTYARTEKVDLVLIPGDLFDSEYVTRETLAHITRELASLSCPVVISPGNHDACNEKSVWLRNDFPQNVYVFKSDKLDVISFDELGVDVYGYAFSSPEMSAAPIYGHVKDSDRINLLCAHLDLGATSSGYAPISPDALFAFGCDYYALGHIHNPSEPIFRENSAAAYSGCPEGRAPDEVGIKGAIIANIEKGVAPKLKFVRFCRRRYENATLDCTGASSASEIEAMASGLISERKYSDDTILTLTLTGRLSPYILLTPDVYERLGKNLFSINVKDETSAELGLDYLERDAGIKGEFYRLLKPQLESGEAREREIAKRALRYGLSALDGGGVTD